MFVDGVDSEEVIGGQGDEEVVLELEVERDYVLGQGCVVGGGDYYELVGGVEVVGGSVEDCVWDVDFFSCC